MDWDDAYENMKNIPGGSEFPPRWNALAEAYRAEIGDRRSRLAYGDGARQWADLYLPDSTPKGLAVFVHGGYWMKLSPDSWSHLAKGALAHGWAVGMPCYTLCPEARISGITQEICTAIQMLATEVDGPIRLAGHSAGGHLVTRQICTDSRLGDGHPELPGRVEHVLSISGVHDLRPLLQTGMNQTLGLDMTEARAESPCLLEPITGAQITCWVGADERPEFVRQNALLANVWSGFDVHFKAVEDPGLHHFNIIDALADPGSPMITKWLG
ncbi:MAG: alpha/beta hydrolase [Pseudomonadota bacterium]